MISCFAYYFIGDSGMNSTNEISYQLNNASIENEQATMEAQDTENSVADTQ